MKLRYFLTSIIACLALAIGCTQEELPALSEIQVTPSYFTFGVDGGSKTVTVTAADAWEVTDVPAWLNVSPAKGEATGADGVKVTITAAPTTSEEIITATLKFNCAGKAQLVTVGQEAYVPDFPKFTEGEYWIMFDKQVAVPIASEYGYLYTAKASVSEDGKLSSTADNIFTFKAVEGGFTIQGPDGKYYYMKGTYDSFNVDASPVDGSVWTVQQVGDGKFKVMNAFNSKVMQFDPAYSSAGAYSSDRANSIYPNLVSVAGGEIAEVTFAVEPTEVELEKEAGDFNINMTCKNEGFEIKPSASWIVLKGMTSTEGEYVVTFSYEANEGGARSATIDFISGEETITVEVTQLGGIADVTVAEFLAAEVGPSLFRLTGVVKNIANTTYGNFDLVDATGSVYVYGLTNNGEIGSNDKTFESLGINEGDVVTIIGTRADYKGTAQVGGTAYLVSHVPATESTVIDFLAQEVAADKWFKLTGKVSNIASDVYGNFDLVDETGSVYVYGLTVAPVSSNDKSFAKLGLKEGDIVTLVGTRAEYKGTAQVGGPAYYISHEAAPAEGGNEGGDDNTGEEGGAITGTYTYTFVKDDLGANGSPLAEVTLNGVKWNFSMLDSGSKYLGWDSNDSAKGVQIGKSADAATEVTLSTTSIAGTVKSIKVNTSGASGTDAKLNVTVGGSAFGTEVALTTSAADYTFEGSASGEIVLKWTCTAKAIYIKSIEIVSE